MLRAVAPGRSGGRRLKVCPLIVGPRVIPAVVGGGLDRVGAASDQVEHRVSGLESAPDESRSKAGTGEGRFGGLAVWLVVFRFRSSSDVAVLPVASWAARRATTTLSGRPFARLTFPTVCQRGLWIARSGWRDERERSIRGGETPIVLRGRPDLDGGFAGQSGVESRGPNSGNHSRYRALQCWHRRLSSLRASAPRPDQA